MEIPAGAMNGVSLDERIREPGSVEIRLPNGMHIYASFIGFQCQIMGTSGGAATVLRARGPVARMLRVRIDVKHGM